MSRHLPGRQTERRGPRLWPVGPVLALAFTAALLAATTVFYTAGELLGAHGIQPQRRIGSKTLFELVKLSFGVVAGAGALVALIVAHRRQRVDEDGALRDTTCLHTERFTTAVSQLGDESATDSVADLGVSQCAGVIGGHARGVSESPRSCRGVRCRSVLVQVSKSRLSPRRSPGRATRAVRRRCG